MSKTRKIVATLTMVAVTTTASLTAVSSAQAHFMPGPPHLHAMPGPLTPGPIGPVVPGPFIPLPPGGGVAPPPPPPPSPPPHHHGGLRRGEAAALGLLGGVLIGGALANANRRQAQPVRPAPAAGLPAAHYAWCDAKYKTYVIATNTFTGYDMKPHPCVSPYVY